MWQRLKTRFQLTPAPGFIVALYLSLRWHCRVSPRAVIRFPFKLTIGRGSRIYRCSLVASGRGITLGESVDIYDGCILNSLEGEISIKNQSTFGPNVTIYGYGPVTIGSHVSINSYAMVVAGKHNFSDRDRPIMFQGATGEGILIEDDVWVATHVVVLDGVTVGTGSVLAAGAVVTKDVPPYSVVAGVPARVIRNR